jgi:hypothetical protein
MDHQQRQARAERDRLSAQAVRLPFSGSTFARAASRRLGEALVHLGTRLGGASPGGTAPVPSARVAAGSLGSAR